MRTYRVKGDIRRTWVQVCDEKNDEIYLLVIKQLDGDQKISRDRISRHLFDVCLQTGYLIEEQADVKLDAQKLSA